MHTIILTFTSGRIITEKLRFILWWCMPGKTFRRNVLKPHDGLWHQNLRWEGKQTAYPGLSCLQQIVKSQSKAGEVGDLYLSAIT